MYTQFRELKSNEPFKPEIIENMRENIGKRVPLAVGQSTKDSSIIALVIVDAPEIPWTMAGSPMMILFQNDARARLPKYLRNYRPRDEQPYRAVY